MNIKNLKKEIVDKENNWDHMTEANIVVEHTEKIT